MRIGVFICHCGSNIGGTVDCAKVAETARAYPDVVYAVDLMYSCAEPGQAAISRRPSTSTSWTAWWWPPAARACTSPRSAAPWNAPA